MILFANTSIEISAGFDVLHGDGAHRPKTSGLYIFRCCWCEDRGT